VPKPGKRKIRLSDGVTGHTNIKEDLWFEVDRVEDFLNTLLNCLKMNETESSELNDLKGMRTRERNNITCFCSAINGFTQGTSAEDSEYYGYHLYNTLIRLELLDDAIHDFLFDVEYYEDVET
jgi:hypothetical protein